MASKQEGICTVQLNTSLIQICRQVSTKLKLHHSKLSPVLEYWELMS